MSTTRGGNDAKRGQRYQNSWRYKPGLHKTGKQKAIPLTLAYLCTRCKDIIEWKRKYDKYKPLATPRKWCVRFDHDVMDYNSVFFPVQCVVVIE